MRSSVLPRRDPAEGGLPFKKMFTSPITGKRLRCSSSGDIVVPATKPFRSSTPARQRTMNVNLSSSTCHFSEKVGANEKINDGLCPNVHAKKRTLHLVFLFQRQRLTGGKFPQLFIKHPAMILLSSNASIIGKQGRDPRKYA